MVMNMSETIILPNEVLLSMAAQVVAEGKTVIIPVTGQSMYPFIHGSEDCVELSMPVHIQKGDIVLAEISPGKYLLHRIYQFKGKEGIVLMGDGNIHNKEYCVMSDIRAKAVIVISPNGKRKRLYSPSMQLMAGIWKMCLPVRGLLLRIFKKLY